MAEVVDEMRVTRDRGSDTMYCAACGCAGTDLLADAPFSPYAFVLHDECGGKLARAILAALPAADRESLLRQACAEAGLRVLAADTADTAARHIDSASLPPDMELERGRLLRALRGEGGVTGG